MPYIIHTFTENRWPPDHNRRAVATLDEARVAAHHAVTDAMPAESVEQGGYSALTRHKERNPFLGSIGALPEQGGTVGPLPDGTVIEVAAVSDDQLRAQVAPGRPGTYTDPLDEIIAAYNAE